MPLLKGNFLRAFTLVPLWFSVGGAVTGNKAMPVPSPYVQVDLRTIGYQSPPVSPLLLYRTQKYVAFISDDVVAVTFTTTDGQLQLRNRRDPSQWPYVFHAAMVSAKDGDVIKELRLPAPDRNGALAPTHDGKFL